MKPARGEAECLDYFGAEDRVLFLGIPDLAIVRQACAQALSVVCLGDRDTVYEARREARDLRNVMFHPGEGRELPFDDACLNCVVGTSGAWSDPGRVAREVARVLSGGGLALIATEDSDAFQAAGLERESSTDGLAVLRKPAPPDRGNPPVQLPVLG